MKQAIKITLQIIISVIIALEVSYPPNDYIHELIVCLILYICVKNNVDDKILSLIDKYSPL